MAHAQTGMSTLFRVGRWPAPVLGEEEAQPLPRRTEVIGIGIARQQEGVALDPVRERIHEPGEERHPPDRGVQRVGFDVLDVLRHVR